ncbi:MAG: glycine cleavage system protein T, partial [Gammaproteobacteria bacterium]|nr:glycine cleavage system protein T [Gammaproteobacteria bacterium]
QALQRIRADGCPRRVVGAFMDGPAFEKNNENRWPVSQNGKNVGEITAAVFSPRLERNIGILFVDTTAADLGMPMRVDTPEDERELEVTNMPFIDPKKQIPRQKLR